MYGIIQGLCIMLVCFITLERSPDQNGFLGCYIDEGSFTYLAVVVLVNIKLVTSTNSHDGGVALTVTGSIVMFFLFFFGINLIPSSTIYKTFSDIFVYSNFVTDLFFMTVSLVMVDIGLHHA
jgi:hypothetical protein